LSSVIWVTALSSDNGLPVEPDVQLLLS